MELNQFRDVDLVIDKANDNFIQRQFVSQGDYKGRTLTVQVTDNGLIGKVPGLMLNLRWQNQASGLADLSAFDCIDAENSIFRIAYPEYMMTPGKVIANIQVIQDGHVTHLKSFELTVQNLAGEMTGIVKKAEYGALVAILADANKFRTDIENLGNDKADKTALAETDAEVAELDSTKADKTALANTNQQVSGLVLNKVDKGGAGQITIPMLSQGVKEAMAGGSVAVVGENAITEPNVVNGSLPPSKLSDSIDYLTTAEILENKYMTSVAEDRTVVFADTSNYWVAKIGLKEIGYLLITKSALQHGMSLVILDNQDKAIERWGNQFDNGLFNYAWANNYDTYYQINVELLKTVYPNAAGLYTEFKIEDRETAFVRGIKTEDLTARKWGAGQSFDTLRNVPNRLADKYDLLKEPESVMYANKSIIRYTAETRLPEFVSATNRTSFYFTIPQQGALEFPLYTLPDQQFLMVVDGDKKVIKNYDYQYNTGGKTVPFLIKDVTAFKIDIDTLLSLHPTAKSIYLVVWNKAVDGFYVSATNAFDVSDVFPAIKPSTANSNKEIVASTVYPVVEGKTGYIYLDNLYLNGNYYNDKDLFVSQTSDNNLIAGGFPVVMSDSDINVPISRIVNGETVERASILCKSVPATAGEGESVNIMMIGESTTEMPGFLSAIKSKFVDDVLTVNFVGTRGSTVKHEGRSGWTTSHLINSENYNNATNSFWNPTTKKFDYGYYKTQYPDVPTPDIVLLSFGINDPNQNVAPQKTIENLYFLIGQIRIKNPNVKFVIGLTSNLCRIENVAYRTESRRNNILKTIKALIEEFDGRQSEGYFLNPMYLCVDPIWDMRYDERPISIYQSKSALYATDGTHPADQTGYQKTADCTYNVIKYAASN